MQSLKQVFEKYTVAVVVVMLVLFVTFGVVYAASTQTNCGLGPKKDDPTVNDTPTRKDDQSWFSHFVCTGLRAQQNR